LHIIIDNFIYNQEFQGNIDTEIRLSHILLSLPSAPTQEEIEQVKLMAETVRADILAGTDFNDTAKTVSDGQNAASGGDLGWRKTSQIPSLFSEYVPNMSKGDVSEPIQSPSGFHLIQMSDVKSDEKTIVEQTHARHILIKMNQLINSEQAEKKLIQLKQRIDNGDDFAILAKGNSDDTVSAVNGGDLGWTSAGQLVPEFQREMDLLEPGQISGPFQSNYGWHIVQVLERRSHDSTDTVKRGKARAVIYNRKLQEAVQNWARELRDEAYVEYRLDEF
jgi:peptidyl-prolyl cis-trans isomerase SurA